MSTPTRSRLTHQPAIEHGRRGESVATCSGLSKIFGERAAVDGVGFSIATGETYGLLGPNGAGKTTTISMLCGLVPPDAGTVTVAGQALGRHNHTAKAAIGLVPQEIALYPDLSARENLDFFGRLQGLDRRQRRTRITEVLEVVGLSDRASDRVGEYSGGMQRRCNIAVGLLHQPRLLVLDEPTVGVDPQSRNQILDSIEALGGAGMSVLYTTHYMEEAERLCDRIGIMDTGHMIAEGTRRELLTQVGEHDRIRITTTAHDLDTLRRWARTSGTFLSVIETAEGVEGQIDDGRRAVATVVDGLEYAAVEVSGIEVIEPDLETVFLHLTGRALRD
ncbi:MAG: ABC transporter ATP-binding protein [Acidimicrobiales bacterium]